MSVAADPPPLIGDPSSAKEYAHVMLRLCPLGRLPVGYGVRPPPPGRGVRSDSPGRGVCIALAATEATPCRLKKELGGAWRALRQMRPSKRSLGYDEPCGPARTEASDVVDEGDRPLDPP